MLSISSISSGAPFTVYSGIQQTGAGSAGVDRPDQIAKPHLSTARKDRKITLAQERTMGRIFSAFRCLCPAVRGRTRDASERWDEILFADRLSTITTLHLSRTHRLDAGERSGARGLQFRAEFFNLFNIVNMGTAGEYSRRLDE